MQRRVEQQQTCNDTIAEPVCKRPAHNATAFSTALMLQGSSLFQNLLMNPQPVTWGNFPILAEMKGAAVDSSLC